MSLVSLSPLSLFSFCSHISGVHNVIYQPFIFGNMYSVYRYINVYIKNEDTPVTVLFSRSICRIFFLLFSTQKVTQKQPHSAGKMFDFGGSFVHCVFENLLSLSKLHLCNWVAAGLSVCI